MSKMLPDHTYKRLFILNCGFEAHKDDIGVNIGTSFELTGAVAIKDPSMWKGKERIVKAMNADLREP